MRRFKSNCRGFTLIELMVVVAVIAIVAMAAGLRLSSRLASARIEEVALTMKDDLTYARGAAVLKGCPVRLIFCMGRPCLTAAQQTIEEVTLNADAVDVIGQGSDPATGYAILRMANPEGSGRRCEVDDAQRVPAVAGPGLASDNLNDWDFDRAIRSISSGIVFKNIYRNLANMNVNWLTTADAAAADSLYFDPPRPFARPVVTTNDLTVTGDYIIVQVQPDSCDPSTDEDCIGMFVTLSPGGVLGAIPCVAGGRANSTNRCF